MICFSFFENFRVSQRRKNNRRKKNARGLLGFFFFLVFILFFLSGFWDENFILAPIGVVRTWCRLVIFGVGAL